MVRGMRLGILLTAVTLASTVLVAAPTYAGPAPLERPAVVEKKVIGHSVQGRPITAWHLGQPGKRKVLLIATMHGDEGKPRQILTGLRDGRAIRGVDLWVVPVYNPDGLARGTRKNAHGVDLNRNFPYRWADLDGSYESGPRAASEPETRAMMRFLRTVKPSRIISFHQPLHGVDTDTKDRGFSRRVARALDLPTKSFTCGGVCHGTMTGWFNSRFSGSALTVEYGYSPSHNRMTKAAPRQLLELFGARRVRTR
jgi:murein peptide amidase A